MVKFICFLVNRERQNSFFFELVIYVADNKVYVHSIAHLLPVSTHSATLELFVGAHGERRHVGICDVVLNANLNRIARVEVAHLVFALLVRVDIGLQ